MSDVAVFVAPDVAAVRRLWERSGALEGTEIVAQLAAYADVVVAASASGERGAEVLVRNWSNSLDNGVAEVLSHDDARSLVARDHGFLSWSAVTGRCDVPFERAADAVVLGRIDELRHLLLEDPALVRGRSAYGHGATLLHYVAANGVEIRRQMVPSNAAEIAAALLASGADSSATLEAYGGSLDTLTLLRSSGHPRAAGVAEEVAAVLAGTT